MFENELLHEWGVWFCFVEGTDSKEKYDDTYNLIYSLKTPSDLAYVWNESGLSSLSNFLLREDSKHRR